MQRLRRRLAALALVAAASPAWASEAHSDPSAPVVLALGVILVCAKLGGDVATRLKQPAVLGELMAGVVLGNLNLLGVGAFETIESSPFIDMFARVGVIVLLFEVGLESTVTQMMKVGTSALSVATIGVLLPFALGWGAAAMMLPSESTYLHMFIGATLTATSVGITARVLQDLGRSQSAEARIILGAAVIDDVMGLVLLAVVTGIIQAAAMGTSLAAGQVVLTLVKAIGFLVGALLVGAWVSPKLFNIASKLRARRVLLAFGLGFCFTLAFLADLIGLAPIVGAFAAGLIFEDVHFVAPKDREPHTLEALVKPVSDFLVPVFFVLMGMMVELKSFTQPGVLLLAGALSLVGFVGKAVAGLGARGGGLDRLSIGVGMVPRGEVGLIFARIGADLRLNGRPVIEASVLSALVVVVIVTTMLTPPLLSYTLRRRPA